MLTKHYISEKCILLTLSYSVKYNKTLKVLPLPLYEGIQLEVRVS